MVDLNVRHQEGFILSVGAIIVLSDVLIYRVCEIVSAAPTETHVKGFLEINVG